MTQDSSGPASALAIELKNIHKCYGAVHACRAVDLRVSAGTVHCVVGENGAGKSTLMKIAYGHVGADDGMIALKGKVMPQGAHAPALAIAQGVGMVHQHFMLIEPLTVCENVILGSEPTRAGVIDLATAEQQIAALAERLGFSINATDRIEDLSVGERQRVEILKVLWRGADVVILDEPTAVLTPGEVRALFSVLRQLVADGLTVVLITHKLDEVVDIADRVTVMRHGAVTREFDRDQLSTQDLVRAMVGRSVVLEVEKTPASRGDTKLRVSSVSVRGTAGNVAVNDVSFSVTAGEILGIAGVEGNGQSELIEAITGLRSVDSGRIVVAEHDITQQSVLQRRRAGLAHVPEDRHARALVLDFDVAANSILGQQHDYAHGWGLDAGRIAHHAHACIREFDIRPADTGAVVRGLSGGNQQKLVVARELSQEGVQVLVCAQPTRGVDIGAIELIHKRVIRARDQGLAVLLFSAELKELRVLSDRLLVMYRGRIVGELDHHELAKPAALERVGALMTGVEAREAS